MQKFDVVIIGGGMVGASLARALSTLPLSIALIDSSPIEKPEDHRLIALNYGSVCFFKNLNVWDELKPYAGKIQTVHASTQGRFGSTRIRAEELNLPALGYVVPAKNINAVLATHYKQLRLTELSQTKESVNLVFDTGEVIQAQFVIAADGSHSTVRELLKIPTEKHDYKQTALVTETILSREHKNIAYERFLKEGVLAMLPLKGEKVATIWTASNEKIAALGQLSDEAFLSELQREFGFRLGRFKGLGKRATYPLQFIKANQPPNDRVLLIGNAARTLHPLAAQGLNLALYEVALLAQLFTEKPLDQIYLQEFNSDSFSQKLNTRVSHYLTSLFSTDLAPLGVLRQCGMVGMDILGGLKKPFAASLAGQSGPLPRLFLDSEKV